MPLPDSLIGDLSLGHSGAAPAMTANLVAIPRIDDVWFESSFRQVIESRMQQHPAVFPAISRSSFSPLGRRRFFLRQLPATMSIEEALNEVCRPAFLPATWRDLFIVMWASSGQPLLGEWEIFAFCPRPISSLDELDHDAPERLLKVECRGDEACPSFVSGHVPIDEGSWLLLTARDR